MERNVREFLRETSAEELQSQHILSPHRRYNFLLQGVNVVPLVDLMRQRGVSKLTSHDGNWFLAVDGTFANPKSREIKTGPVKQLEHAGNVFWGQNASINPYFGKYATNSLTRNLAGFPRITVNPEVMRGKPCVRGMRVTVDMVVGMTESGHSTEKMLELYPYLEVEDIAECLAFAGRKESRSTAASASSEC